LNQAGYGHLKSPLMLQIHQNFTLTKLKAKNIESHFAPDRVV